MFIGIWAFMMLTVLANIGSAVYLGVRSNAGKWSRYPIIGGIVARLGGFNEAR